MKLGEIIKSSFFHQNTKYTYREHVYYKIVDYVNEKYVLQCINTQATMYLSLDDIIADTDILIALHPIQACYIGIEYAKYIKTKYPKLKQRRKLKSNANISCQSRYGRYCIYCETRCAEMEFYDNLTKEQWVIYPRDIALSEELISEFDASQSFYIGLSAGLKLQQSARQKIKTNDHGFVLLK